MPRDQWAEARDRQLARRTKRRGGDEGYDLPKGMAVEVKRPGSREWTPHVMQRTVRFADFRLTPEGQAVFQLKGYVIRTIAPTKRATGVRRADSQGRTRHSDKRRGCRKAAS